jgi:hypothetical protein
MDHFGLLSGNQELVKSCRSVSNEKLQHAENAATVIINALWQKLKQTHKLRVIK